MFVNKVILQEEMGINKDDSRVVIINEYKIVLNSYKDDSNIMNIHNQEDIHLQDGNVVDVVNIYVYYYSNEFDIDIKKINYINVVIKKDENLYII